jgi:tellurite resistance-related uncharacterized protein
MAALPYRTTPVFDETSLPAALRAAHSTKAGVWGMVRVLAGRVKLIFVEPKAELVLDPETPGRLLPQQVHYVEPLGPMQMCVAFYDSPPE